MSNMKYVDAFDNDRVLEPMSGISGKEVECKVWWFDKNRNTFDYGGRTTISATLFGDTGWHARLGFTPFRPQPEVPEETKSE